MMVYMVAPSPETELIVLTMVRFRLKLPLWLPLGTDLRSAFFTSQWLKLGFGGLILDPSPRATSPRSLWPLLPSTGLLLTTAST